MHPSTDPPSSRVDPTPPPVQDADVVIIGGSLAGIATALFLAERGVSVCLLEARARLGQGASGRHLGHVSTGLIEHPYRLVHALGIDRAKELYRWSQANQQLLAARFPTMERGGWWAATDAREPEQIRRSAQALQRMGIGAQEVGEDAVNAALGTTGLRSALFIEEDGILDAAGSVEALAASAVRAGAQVALGCSVRAVDTGGARVEVEYGRDEGAGTVRGEVVVFAAGPWLPKIEPWFDDKLTPVREQALITGPIPPLPRPGGRAGYGYTFWRQEASGRLLAGGCRWATPHLEVGETDDRVVVDRVQQRIEGFLQRHLPAAAAAGVEGRWSWIVDHSCDGLPLVGPLPGDPRRIAIAGFGGNAPGLALAAAKGVVDGLCTSLPSSVPDFLAASRFL